MSLTDRQQPTQFLAVKIGLDLDIYRHIVENDEPISLDKLVEGTKASRALLGKSLTERDYHDDYN